jgi:hypothetical protein
MTQRAGRSLLQQFAAARADCDRLRPDSACCVGLAACRVGSARGPHRYRVIAVLHWCARLLGLDLASTRMPGRPSRSKPGLRFWLRLPITALVGLLGRFVEKCEKWAVMIGPPRSENDMVSIPA